MLVDIIIILLLLSALYRGNEIGFIRQLCSTIGFILGLFAGAWLERFSIISVHSANLRIVVTLVTTLGLAIVGLVIGEQIGHRIKLKVLFKKINHFDNKLGSVLSALTLLFCVWLIATIVGTLPFPGPESQVHGSQIVRVLDKTFPNAPSLIADLGNLVDPNGFPQVFIGSEPLPRGNISLPALGDLQNAVNMDKDSVVKVAGQGCGGIVEGSGFMVGPDLIATNAHVLAGINHPYVQDVNGTHNASVIWFDPNLDFAVLRVSNLGGRSLVLNTAIAPSATAAVVLGYPGGGYFTAKAAAVMDQFNASGRNIYGRGNTNRDIYEIKADIIPGNSGGPLVVKDGSVIGVVFAESTEYKQVGYALTASKIAAEINQAVARNQTVNTGRCAN